MSKNTYIKLDVGEDQNQYVRYASEISGNNLEFIATIEAENGLWTPDRRSDLVGSNGYRDQGICQINPGFHPEITNDPRFSDGFWQVEQCWKLFQGGTKFYGRERLKTDSKFREEIYSHFILTL